MGRQHVSRVNERQERLVAPNVPQPGISQFHRSRPEPLGTPTPGHLAHGNGQCLLDHTIPELLVGKLQRERPLRVWLQELDVSGVSSAQLLETTTTFVGEGDFTVNAERLSRRWDGQATETMLYQNIESSNSSAPGGWLPHLLKLQSDADGNPFESSLTRSD
jgi:hypothetical protein